MQQHSTLGREVDIDRFWQDVQTQARIGALPEGGLGRLALDKSDIEARLWLMQEAASLGASAFHDPIGNLYLRREGRTPELPPLLIGSHMDSQPKGGFYDGALGVIAGLAVLRTLHEQDITLERPVEVVSWTNEEGARFAPGTPGSAWFAGARDIAAIMASHDDAGVSFEQALAPCLEAMDAKGSIKRETPVSPSAYLELHIEQGPVLDAGQLPACVVGGIQGVNWYRVHLQGRANHAGTTPMDMRQDAVMGAHALIRKLEDCVNRQDSQVRFTIGKFSVAPGSINTIADDVSFTVDLRHPDASVLAAIDDDFAALTATRWRGCQARLERLSSIAPVAFDPNILESLEQNLERYGTKAPRLVSGAFHDAIHLANLCPSAMLFVACRDGISHHPDEHAEKDDAAVAVRTLTDTVLELAQG